MKAIRISTQLDSTTLHLPVLAPLVGRYVEIIVLEDLEESRRSVEEAIRSSPRATEAFGEALMETGALARLA